MTRSSARRHRGRGRNQLDVLSHQSVSRRTPTSSSPPRPKFGLSVASGAAMAAVRARFATDHLRLLGLHSHIGSQIFDVDGFELAAHRVIGLLARRRRRVRSRKDGTDRDRRSRRRLKYLVFAVRTPIAELAAKLGTIVSDESTAGPPTPCSLWSRRSQCRTGNDHCCKEVAPAKDVRLAPQRIDVGRQRRRRHERQHSHRASRRGMTSGWCLESATPPPVPARLSESTAKVAISSCGITLGARRLSSARRSVAAAPPALTAIRRRVATTWSAVPAAVVHAGNARLVLRRETVDVIEFEVR